MTSSLQRIYVFQVPLVVHSDTLPNSQSRFSETNGEERWLLGCGVVLRAGACKDAFVCHGRTRLPNGHSVLAGQEADELIEE